MTALDPQLTYSKPQTSPPVGGWDVGTIADYMTIPTGVEDFTVDSTYFRAYALIVNEWFRSEVVQSPVVINVGDSNTVGSNGSNYITDLEKGGKPFIVNKFYDVFTGCTPTAQKGPAVLIPTGSVSNLYPVVSTADKVSPDLFPKFDTTHIYGVHPNARNGLFNSSGLVPVIDTSSHNLNNLTNSGTSATFSTSGTDYSSTDPYLGITFDNLWAIGSGGLGASINELRQAFQLQKFYEREAIGDPATRN